ncbi:hypothetical protein JTB14_028541 [Gonioctena quinquepunctata]|nr:hypothetical protein JTB14_028541 [Gonioctena quinquepunctata]
MGNEKPSNSRSTRSNSVSSEGNQLYEILSDIKKKLDCCFEIISKQSFEQLQIEIHNLKDNLTTAVSQRKKLRNLADAMKNKKNDNHILVVKPKDDKDSNLVTKNLKKSIDPAELKIGLNIEKNARHGGVIVKCSNSGAKIQEPKRLVPRIVSTGLADEDKNVEPKDLLVKIIQKNKIPQEEDFKFQYLISTKGRKCRFSMIVEVDPNTFKLLMKHDNHEPYVGWSICKIY